MSAAHDVEVCVVGAGPHGLAAVAHLLAAKPRLRNRLAVVEPSGDWLSTWREQFARLDIEVLRSPIVHHPDVDPAALTRFVTDERLERSNLPYDPPFTSTFESYCRHVIDRLDIADLPTAARVGALDVDEGDGRCVVTTDVGTIRARHVIWTGNSCTSVFPHAVAEADASPRVQHGGRVDLRDHSDLTGEHVVVVGGGLSAGHLAVGALERGARVTLLTRRRIVERDFDVEPGWLGPRHLAAYWDEKSPARRLDIARSARGGGSMPAWMCRRLDRAVADGELDHVVGDVETCCADDRSVQVGVDGRSVVADRLWSATGTRPHVDADPALAAFVEEHVDGIPTIDRDLRITGSEVFVSGRLATIELGPAAGNLWGARMAARRIAHALTGVDLETDDVPVPAPPVQTANNEKKRWRR